MKLKLNRRQIIILVILIIISSAARLIPGPRTIDDAYITFRYARNILNGDGFLFNSGERVLGTTTPFYTLLMVCLGGLTGGTQAPFPWLALLVNTAADAATCILLWQIGRHLDQEWVGLAAAAVWCVAPFSVTFAIGGLETSVVVLLLTTTIYFYMRGQYGITALVAALAILTRPDSVILVGPLIIDRLVRILRFKEWVRLKEVLAFFLPTLAWAGFATIYFGSPISHSVQAKLAVYHLQSTEALVRLLQHYATPFLEQNTFGAVGVAVGLVLYPFLYLVGARRAWRLEPRLLSYLLYPWLYFLVFAIANPLIFRWYLTPPLPPYFFFILLGAEQILFKLTSVLFKPSALIKARWIPIILIFVLPLASSLTGWQLHPDHGPDRPAPGMAWFKLELLYRQSAEILSPYLDSSKVLAAGDVGTLGYYTSAHVLDTVGLNSAQSMKYYPMDPQSYVINYAIPTDLIQTEKPDYIVILEVYARRTFLIDATFQQQYQLLQTLPTDIYGSQDMLIFKRK